MSFKEIAKDTPVSTWLVDSFTREEIEENNILSDVSAIIQRRRQELDLTQSQLAQKMGVTQGLISRWENGEENLTMETVSKIAIALDLSTQSPLIPPFPIKRFGKMDVHINLDYSQKNDSRQSDIQWEIGSVS